MTQTCLNYVLEIHDHIVIYRGRGQLAHGFTDHSTSRFTHKHNLTMHLLRWPVSVFWFLVLFLVQRENLQMSKQKV